MGQRGEVFSTRVYMDEGRKTFFFNVKENRFRDTYLNIVESRKTDSGFKRSSVVVFNEDLTKFLTILNKSADMIRSRKPTVQETLTVGAGRREYTFRTPPRGKPALMITEERQDSTGSRRESIMVPAAGFEDFFDGLNKALSAMKKN